MILQRLRAMQIARVAMGACWRSRTPLRQNIVVFHCTVYNAGLSGLEPYVLSRDQETAIEGRVAGYGLRLLGKHGGQPRAPSQ